MSKKRKKITATNEISWSKPMNPDSWDMEDVGTMEYYGSPNLALACAIEYLNQYRTNHTVN